MMYENDLSRRWLLRRCGMAAAGLLAAPALPGSSPAASEPALRQIQAITFSGTYNLVIWAAQAKGFFAGERLEVTRERTPTSMHLARETVGGRFQIALAAIDNVVAYNEGQGQVELDRPADLFSFMSLWPNTRLPLLVQGEIGSFEDLKGKTLAVDAISTGFSFVLRKILEAHGLGLDDYTLVSVGNARQRLAALKKGEHAGAVLTPPFDALARKAGLRELGSSADAFDQYQGTCFLTTRRWAAAHREELTAFTRAVLRTEDWLRAAENHPQAGEILARNMEGIDPAAAPRIAAAVAGRLDPDLNVPGIETVLALRSQYGEPKKILDDPSRYVDTSYLERARATL